MKEWASLQVQQKGTQRRRLPRSTGPARPNNDHHRWCVRAPSPFSSLVSQKKKLLSPPCQLSYLFFCTKRKKKVKLSVHVSRRCSEGGKLSKYSSPGLFLTFLPAQRIPLPPLAPIPWNWKLELDLHPILAAKPHHFQQ